MLHTSVCLCGCSLVASETKMKVKEEECLRVPEEARSVGVSVGSGTAWSGDGRMRVFSLSGLMDFVRGRFWQSASSPGLWAIVGVRHLSLNDVRIRIA